MEVKESELNGFCSQASLPLVELSCYPKGPCRHLVISHADVRIEVCFQKTENSLLRTISIQFVNCRKVELATAWSFCSCVLISLEQKVVCRLQKQKPRHKSLNLHSVLITRYVGAMVAEKLWEWPDWFNLKPHHQMVSMRYTTQMARKRRLDNPENQSRARHN